MSPSKRTEHQSSGSPPPQLARALIRSLTRGTTVAEGVGYIQVGNTAWLDAQRELLAEIAEDGHSDTKFVRGAYGSGKSHFLSVVQGHARSQNWVTAHVECKVDHVQIDRFETLYPAIAGRLLSKDMIETATSHAEDAALDPVRFLLDRWAGRQLTRVGVKEDGLRRPFDAEVRIHAQLQSGLFQTNLPPDFTRALAAFVRASLAHDFETTSAACRWLRGIAEKIQIPTRYLQRPGDKIVGKPISELRPIGKGTAHDVMRGLLWLVRSSGYAGLVLCIDEVEELAKLGTRKRQDQALQALREYVDHAGGEGGYKNLCMYLAATPEMFEGPDYFPRYDALATRIQPLSPELNWRAPVVDLDRTPLSLAEMRQMASRIRDVYRTAYELATPEFSDGFLDRLLKQLAGSRLRIARPRLLARVLVGELERERQEGRNYRMPSDFEPVLGRAAKEIAQEA